MSESACSNSNCQSWDHSTGQLLMSCYEPAYLKEAEEILVKEKIGLSDAFYFKTGEYLLRFATAQNNVKMVELLLKYGETAGLHKQVNEDKALYEIALDNGFYKIACLLMAYSEVKEDKRPYLISYFHRILRAGRADVLEALIEYGVLPAIKLASPIHGYNQSTYFHEVFRRGNVEMVRIYMDKMQTSLSHAINLRNARGNTPLIVASRFGKPDIVQFLINKGADLHLQTSAGTTALEEAVMDNRSKVVEVLLKNGAIIDPSLKLFCLAAKLNSNGKDTLEVLLNYGADLNEADNNGNTALHLCISEETLKFLVLKGIDIHKKNNKNQDASEYITEIRKQPLDSDLLNPFPTITQFDVKATSEEVEKMKTVRLNRTNTLYDFMSFKNPRALSRYANNICLNDMFNKSKNFSNDFPIYDLEICQQFLKALERKRLVDSAAKYMLELSGMKIPELCSLELFDLFSNAELNQFLENRDFIEDERIDVLMEVIPTPKPNFTIRPRNIVRSGVDEDIYFKNRIREYFQMYRA